VVVVVVVAVVAVVDMVVFISSAALVPLASLQRYPEEPHLSAAMGQTAPQSPGMKRPQSEQEMDSPGQTLLWLLQSMVSLEAGLGI